MSLIASQTPDNEPLEMVCRGSLSLDLSLETPWGGWNAHLLGVRRSPRGISDLETPDAAGVNEGSGGSTLETAVQVSLWGFEEAS